MGCGAGAVMTRYVAWLALFQGSFPPLHLSIFIDPVIRVLFHHPTTTSRHHEVLSGYRPPLLLLDEGPSSLGHPYKL